MSKKALLIAGTGTMGVHVSELLIQEGFECWITSRSKHEDKQGKLHYIQGNPHDQVFLNYVLSMFYWETIVDFTYYSTISETTPEPTVLPPSRIANLSPFSIAIGVISSTVISILSPGITISVPAANSITPVTSVVLK